MAQSELESGDVVNSIGFVIGKPQTESTKGNLKVWLQNTTDAESRYDNDWTTLSDISNNYALEGLNAGDYEWQVRPVCSGDPLWTDPVSFSTANPYECGEPYNAESTAITTSSATLSWEAFIPDDFTAFELQYNIEPFDDEWTIVDPLTETFYNLTGLEEEKHIQWRVRSLCGSESTSWLSSSFVTEMTDNCAEPSALIAVPNADETANLTWTGVSGENPYYTVAFRRKGTTTWSNIPTMSNSLKLTSLDAGATYEWKVRTNCTVSGDEYTGSFVPGTDFTLPGNTACYKPEKATTKQISETSVVLSWLEIPGITNYEVRYRLKESITWTHVITPPDDDPMTMVSDGSIKIPADLGKMDIIFTNGTPFSYTGGGIYVAMEYSLSEGNISTMPNTALCTNEDSWIFNEEQQTNVHHLLGFNGISYPESQDFPVVLRSNDNRPETWFGSPSFTDKSEVSAIYTLGESAIPFSNSIPVSALIRNYTSDDTELPVSMQITDSEGQLVHSATINQTIPAGCAQLVAFTNWTPNKVGNYVIEISVPALTDEIITDNNIAGTQIQIGGTFVAFSDTATSIAGTGSGTDGGLILCKYNMSGCGKVISSEIFLDQSSVNKTVAAVVVNESGTILATSPWFTVTEDESNAWHSFFFQNPPSFTNEYYYTGLLQPASTEEYQPVGIQWEGTILREGVYYEANLDGTGLINRSTPGRLMIKAGVAPSAPVPYIMGGEILCTGDTKTLSTGSKTIRYASQVISFSSELEGASVGADEALGAPDIWPETSSGKLVWINKNHDSDQEYIELEFYEPAPVNYIDIYETFGSGAIDKVYIFNGDVPEVIYQGPLENSTQEAQLLHIDFALTGYDVSKVKIIYNTALLPGYHALDAVAIGEMNSEGDFASYNWSTGESSADIDITEPGTYSVTVTTASGCSWSESIEVVTPVIIQPVISAAGDTEFCDGGNVVLMSDLDENLLWNNGQTTKSITVTESGTYTVTHNNGCESSTSEGITVTVYPLPDPSITGGAICAGNATTLTGESGFESYEWSTTATTQSISVTLPGYYYLTVTDANGCIGTSYVTAYNAPVPSPQITGDPYYCPGQSTTLNAGGTYTTYQWSTGATGYEIVVSNPLTVSLIVTNEYGCTGTDEVVTGVYPTPQPFISGTLSLCAGSSTRLDVGEGYSSYLWSTGETTSAITVTGAGTFSVSVIDFNGCAGSASAETNEEGALPGIPGDINGQLYGLCNASSIEYSIEPVSNTEYYVWTVPENVTILSGQGTTNITVSATQPVNGFIKVAAANKCGRSQSWNGRAIILDGAPLIPETIMGETEGVCGSMKQYIINPVFGATSYTWSVPANSQLISGQGSNEIWVSFDNNFTTGDICVYAGNDCGVSLTKCITIIGMPQQPALITGPIAVCKKEKNVTYSIEPIANATSYQWTVPMQANIVSGQGTSVIIVDFGNKSGNITVKAINDCGESTPCQLLIDVINCRDSDPYNVYIDPPNSNYEIYGEEWNYAWGEQNFNPEVIGSSGGFISTGSMTISWTIGEPLVNTIGDQSALITQGFHQEYFNVQKVVDNKLQDTYVMIYPVPAKEFVFVKIITRKNPIDIKLDLYDPLGNHLFTDRMQWGIYNREISLTNFSTCMLLLKVSDLNSNQYESFKIIRVK